MCVKMLSREVLLGGLWGRLDGAVANNMALFLAFLQNNFHGYFNRSNGKSPSKLTPNRLS